MRKKRSLLSALLCICLLVGLSVQPVTLAYAGDTDGGQNTGGNSAPDSIVSCSIYLGSDFKITFDSKYSAWLNAITSVTVDGVSYEKTTSSFGVWNNKCYYIDANNDYIVIGEEGVNGTAECVIKADGYADLTLELVIKNYNYSATITQTTQPDPDPDPEPEPDPEPTEYIITDSSYDLDYCLANWLGDATIVKISANLTGVGTTVLPKQVTKLQGWQAKSFFDEEGERQRTLGNNISSEHTFTFEEGSKTTIRMIDFKLNDDCLVIPEGAEVTFESCTFSNVIVNYGTATFKDCTFTTGTIKNYGTANYDGTTEPTDVSNGVHEALAVKLDTSDLKAAVHNEEYRAEIPYTVSGTNAGEATVSAEIVGGNGLNAAAAGNGKNSSIRYSD